VGVAAVRFATIRIRVTCEDSMSSSFGTMRLAAEIIAC
jgi:hypothetical protein